MPKIRYESALKLHAAQALIRNSPARFKVVACGRRAGKTAFALDFLAEKACADADAYNSLYWWATPTYARAVEAYERFERALKPIIRKSRVSTYTHELVNDVRIAFVSLDKWENRKGDGLKGVVIDEAARCKANAWHELIRPSLADHKGWALFLSTPLGRNWFYNEYKRGLRGTDGSVENANYESFCFPTTANPYIDPNEIEEARRTLPDDTFQQEHLAQFLAESAGVFKGLLGCKPTDQEKYSGCLRPPEPSDCCFMGVDLAKHRDYTVITVVTKPRFGARAQLIYFARFNKIDWVDQQLEITRVSRQYNAPIWMDVAGPGDRMYEDLTRSGLRVTGFQFNSPINRGDLIKTLQVEIANHRICIPESPSEIEELWKELQNFEYKVTPGGKLSAGPPDGEHDDTVMSLGLAICAITKGDVELDLTSFHGENQTKILRQIAQAPRQEYTTETDIVLPAMGGMFFTGEATRSPFTPGMTY